MPKKKGLNLYLNSASDYSIVDDSGKLYTIEEARGLMEAGRVADFNAALGSLAACEWDVERLKARYAEMDRARR